MAVTTTSRAIPERKDDETGSSHVLRLHKRGPVISVHSCLVLFHNTNDDDLGAGDHVPGQGSTFPAAARRPKFDDD